MEKSEEFIGVRVPIEMKAKLKRNARLSGRTLSDYIKIILKRVKKKENIH